MRSKPVFFLACGAPHSCAALFITAWSITGRGIITKVANRNTARALRPPSLNTQRPWFLGCVPRIVTLRFRCVGRTLRAPALPMVAAYAVKTGFLPRLWSAALLCGFIYHRLVHNWPGHHNESRKPQHCQGTPPTIIEHPTALVFGMRSEGRCAWVPVRRTYPTGPGASNGGGLFDQNRYPACGAPHSCAAFFSPLGS